MSPQEQIRQLQERVSRLEGLLNAFVRPSEYRFSKPIRGGTDGLRLLTSATEKLSFFSKTPVVQQTANTVPAGGGSGDTDAIDISARTAIGQIRAALVALGLVA
jgi:hypothetical protein